MMPSFVDRVTARARAPREIRRATTVSQEEFAALIDERRGTSVKSKAGPSVSARRAMGSSAWRRGVTYLTESVAGLPWHHYMRVDGDSRERRAKQVWLEEPDVEQTFYGICEYLMVAMIHKGNGFCFKLRNQADQVVGLREIHPDRITTGIAPDNTKRFLVDTLPTVFTTREVLHVPGMVIDGGRFGFNPIQIMADALGIVLAGDEYAGRFYSGGANLGGIISFPQELTKVALERYKAEWDQFHQGLVNAHQTGVLGGGAKYDRISLNAAESQLLEAREFGVTEVARMIGAPPHKLYDLSRATFSNIEHQAIEATTDSVRPWVQRIEHAINADKDLVLPGHFVEASLEGLLRGDSAARSGFYHSGIQDGWLSPYTAARLENLPAPDELDYYLRPLNMAVIRPGIGEEVPDDAPPSEEEAA